MSTRSAPVGELKAAIVPVTPLQQNCTVIWDTVSKIGAVFDPGGDVDRIDKAIDDSGADVQTIYLTHGHIDHASGATELATRRNIPIIGPHIADKFLLDTLEEHAPKFGIFDAKNVTPTRWLDEGETIDIAGHTFDLLHCPGHSPGSIVFSSADNKFALVGDVLFQGSIGRTDFPYGDHEALIAAIRTKLLPLGDDVTFVPGHGPPSTIGHERATNPFIIQD